MLSWEEIQENRRREEHDRRIEKQLNSIGSAVESQVSARQEEERSARAAQREQEQAQHFADVFNRIGQLGLEFRYLLRAIQMGGGRPDPNRPKGEVPRLPPPSSAEVAAMLIRHFEPELDRIEHSVASLASGLLPEWKGIADLNIPLPPNDEDSKASVLELRARESFHENFARFMAIAGAAQKKWKITFYEQWHDTFGLLRKEMSWAGPWTLRILAGRLALWSVGLSVLASAAEDKHQPEAAGSASVDQGLTAFQITGVDSRTNGDVMLVIRALTAESAKAKASLNGIVATGVEELPEIDAAGRPRPPRRQPVMPGASDAHPAAPYAPEESDAQRRRLDEEVRDLVEQLVQGNVRSRLRELYSERLRDVDRAARLGWPDAQWILGLCIEAGIGFQPNPAVARAWFSAAANQGCTPAQLSLGSCYEAGRGGEKDLARAVEWYRRAADAGLVPAMAVMGVRSLGGIGCEKDVTIAVAWLERAAGHGQPMALSQLAACYAAGTGVARDLPRAEALWQQAADRGHPTGIEDGRYIRALRRAEESSLLPDQWPALIDEEVDAVFGDWQPDPAAPPPEARVYAVGEAIENGAGMRMLYVPPGRYKRGSNPGGLFGAGREAGRSDDEAPHEVALTRPFFIAVTPVTQSQWDAVMGYNWSGRQAADLPVRGVCWYDAEEFCRRLSRRERQRYRLPTEAEWEFACRARTVGAYAGTGKLDDMGWYRDNTPRRVPPDDGIIPQFWDLESDSLENQFACLRGVEPQPVGRKRPNALGLLDMHGNVHEWCADYYATYPARGALVIDPAQSSAPTSGVDAKWRGHRVLRGGGYSSTLERCRCAARDHAAPHVRGADHGLRVVMEVPSPAPSTAVPAPPTPSTTVGPPPIPTASSEPAEWWYHASGKPIGPLPLSSLRDLIANRRLPQSVPVWRSGMADWKPAHAVAEVLPSPN